MKKIFTKLTLFALALVGGTQMTMAEDLVLTSEYNKVTWSTTGIEGSYTSISNEAKLEYNRTKTVYLRFSDVELPEGYIVNKANLYWILSQTGNEVVTTISSEGIDVDTKAYSGSDEDFGDTPVNYNVTSLVTVAFKKNAQTSKGYIEFKFVSNSSELSAIIINVSKNLPRLRVECIPQITVEYNVNFLNEKGELIYKDTREGLDGEKVVATNSDLTKYVYNDARTEEYIYSAALTEKNAGKTSMTLKDGADNSLNIYCELNSIIAFKEENFYKYPNSTYCNFKYDLDYSKAPLLNAYILTKIENQPNYLKMTKIEQVPMGVPVYLEYLGTDIDESGESTTINIPVVNGGLIATADDYKNLNVLKAYNEDKSLEYLNDLKEGVVYVLADNGFCRATGNGNLKSGRACIFLKEEVAAQATRLTLIADDEATAVAEVEAQVTSAENVIYNMQGVRVQNATAPGLYIINGKKVLVK